MVIILASCGKSFDAERAQQLCDKFESEGLTEKEWDEFATLFEDIFDLDLEYNKSIQSNIKEGMSSSECDEIREREFEKYEKKGYSQRLITNMLLVESEGKKQMPEKIFERMESCLDNWREKYQEIMAK